MKTIKTRNSVKSIKVLDKSVSVSKRMKDSFIRIKDKAKETQTASDATPTDYASDNIQVTAQGAAEETVYHLPTPRRVNNIRHKASDNWNRAKAHFREVKRQIPKERQQSAVQAQKTAHTTKTNSIKLRSEADHAFTQASEAKAAVNDAKMALKQVKQSGRQTIREVKLNAKQNMKIIRSRGTGSSSIQTHTNTTAGNFSDTPHFASGNMPTSDVLRPVSDVSNAGKLPRQRANAVKMRNRIKTIKKPTDTLKINIGRPISGASGCAERGVSPVTEFSKESLVSQMKLRFSDLNPFRRKAVQDKALVMAIRAPVKTTTIAPSKPIKDGVFRPSYTNTAPKSGEKVGQTLQKSAEAGKSTKKSIKDTAKGTVKTAKISVKTAEKSAKKAVKTAQQTAKTAQKTAKSAAKTAKTAERTARAATKVAAQTAKAAAKAITALVKGAIAAVKGLVTAIVAGGWVAVLVILIICMIGLLVGSIFGIFFSSEPSPGNGKTINSVIREIDTEYTDKIDGIIMSNSYDLLDMSGARASWKEVLAVYTVKTVNDPDNPMDVATVDDERAALLRSVFWEMNVITHSVESYDVEEDVLDDNGIPTGETVVVTKTVLRITVSHKTTEEMADLYRFGDEQKAQLEELLKSDYYALWNSLLYGIATIGDGSIVEVAATQIGNVGGEPYWSWYGFSGRVEWCACFVSWCADVCGYIEAGIIPKFASCVAGEQWFKSQGQWQERGYMPRTGDIIFFDWNGNGVTQHVGIVESVTEGRVNTIEGNTSDTCARRSYNLDSSQIYGYGVPLY